MEATQSQSIEDTLAQAESFWTSGERTKAITFYDAALELASNQGLSDKVGQIQLGKGFALLQLEDATSRDMALDCLQKAKTVASESGNVAQQNFIQMIIEKNGKFETGSNCKDVAPCDDVSILSEKLHKAALANDTSDDSWTSAMTSELIQLVARDGSQDWNKLATEFKKLCKDESNPANTGSDTTAENDKGHQSIETPTDHVTAAYLKQRWETLKPTLQAEFSDQDKERACGHSCGSCPTRSTCQLHDALDIEDMIVFKSGTT
eukprot:m.28609 g.28609  ORF g.28609 m.28609 type:complete len:264 (+) comp15944_c0_seq1:91-882(+)